MQRRLTTILAADVVGYSRLAAADEEGTVSRLRALRHELIDPVIAAHSGRTFKTTGDGRLTEFASVVDAVRAALDVQRGMAQRNANVAAETRIEFRVGIHLGDVIVEGDSDLMGDGVNIAARLEGIAEPGGICLSNAAYEQVRDKIAAAFVDLGEKELKNIARPVRVFALSPSPPRGGGEGRDEVGDSRASVTTSPSRAVGAGPSLSATRRGEEGPPRLSIVVLPFANIGGDPEQEYFVDGVTESLTTDLSRISGSFVIARNTAFTYKGKPVDVKQVGRELNVRYLLEGSVQKGGSRLRVNVQLIETETGAHLWAERFDKPVADLFDMQDEIVARLAGQLNTELIEAEARRAERSSSPDSVDLCFQGMASIQKGASETNLTRARHFFEHALALDPNNVEAMVGTANAETASGGGLMPHDRAQRLAAAEAIAIKALSVAPNHAFAHAILGNVYIWTNRAAQGIVELEHALVLNPNLARAHGFIGLAKIHIGLPEEAEAHVQRALRLSPRDAIVYTWLTIAGEARQHLGKHEEAIAWLNRSIDAVRIWPISHLYLAASLAQLGRLEEARAAVHAGLALDPTFTIRRFRAGRASDHPVYLTHREHVLDGLHKAGVPEG